MTNNEETDNNTESFALENHTDHTTADNDTDLVDTSGPPDGGFRAWMILIGSFTINGLLFSIINTYSLIYSELQKRLTEAGETEVSSKAGKIPRFCKFNICFLYFIRRTY